MRLVFWLAVMVALAHAGPSLPGREITWAKDRLSVRLDQMPLPEVLAAIVKQTGAELRGQPVVSGDLSLQFDRLSLEEALPRILGAQNFTVRYAANGQPSTIVLLGGPEAPPVTAATVAGAAAPPDRPALPLRLGFPRSFPSRRQIELPQALQKVAGTPSATFDQAFDLATLDREGLTRAMAANVVLSQLELDRRLRRSVLSAMAKFDDDTLRNFRGTIEGARVRELLEFFTAHSREHSLQHKSSLALDRFNAAVGSD